MKVIVIKIETYHLMNIYFTYEYELYLRNIIINLQISDIWKIQLTIATNFIISKDDEEERVMYSRSRNVKFTSYDDANEVADDLFEPFRSRYQGNLETSMTGSDFVFDSV